MSRDPSFAIQRALFARLAALSTAAGERIYDDVPTPEQRAQATGLSYPYIKIGDSEVSAVDELHSGRMAVLVRLHVWSEAVGFTEVKAIAAAIYEALDEGELTISGFNLDRMTIDRVRHLNDPNGTTRQAQIDLLIEAHPAA